MRAAFFAGAFGVTVYFAWFQHFFPTGLPEAVRGHGDHNLHMLAFFCLTVLLLPGWRSLMWPLLFMTFAAIVLEVAQIWFPNRGANVADLFASLTGVGLGFLAILAFQLAYRWLLKEPG